MPVSINRRNTGLDTTRYSKDYGFSGTLGSAGKGLPPRASVALALDFLYGTIDPRITFTRASSATYFDSTGRMVTQGYNLLLQSVLPGGTAGTVGSGAVAPTSWGFSSTGGSISYPATSSVQFASTSGSERPFLKQTVAVSASTTYIGSCVVAAQPVSGLQIQNTVHFANSPAGATVTYQKNGVTVGGGAVFVAGDIIAAVLTVSTTAGNTDFRFGNGAIGDSTFGTVTLTSPQMQVGSTASVYTPTTTAANSGPRFDYDPTVPAGTGPEKLTVNNDFSQGLTLWSVSQPTTGSVSAVGNAVRLYAPTGDFCSISTTSGVMPSGNVMIGRAYSMSFDVVVASGGFTVGDGASASYAAGTTSGRYDFTFWAVTNNYVQIKRTAGPSIDFTVSNISVKEVTFAPRGLLIEEQRTNLLLQSRDMTQAAWTASSVDVTPTRNQVGIDGVASSACLITEGATLAAESTQQVTGLAVSTTVSHSRVLKRGNNDWVRFFAASPGGNGYQAWFNLATGALGTNGALGTGTGSAATPVSLGGGWYRCTVVATIGAADTSCNAKLHSASANGSPTRVANATYIVDAAQLEVGAFATSYIPTTTATVTRAADSASMTGTNFSSWYNQTQGTFVVEADKVIAAGANGMMVMPSDGTVANRMYLNGSFQVEVATVSQAAITPSGAAGIVSGIPFKETCAYALNDFAASYNGGTVGTDTVGTLPTLSQMTIGGSVSGAASSQLNGHIRSIRYYNTRLSNAQLQALTA